MTDHLDEAAAKAIELAEELHLFNKDGLAEVARHLTYMAGLLRGGGVRSNEADKDEIESLYWRLEQAENQYAELRTAVIKAYGQLPTPGHEGLIQAASRIDQVRAQRDDLLAAARRFVQADDAVSGAVAMELADVVARLDGRP